MIICFHKKKLSYYKVINMWQQIKNHLETPKYMKTLSPLHFLLTHPFDVAQLSLSFAVTFYFSCLKLYFQMARATSRSETSSVNLNFRFFLVNYVLCLRNFVHPPTPIPYMPLLLYQLQ